MSEFREHYAPPQPGREEWVFARKDAQGRISWYRLASDATMTLTAVYEDNFRWWDVAQRPVIQRWHLMVEGSVLPVTEEEAHRFRSQEALEAPRVLPENPPKTALEK